MYQSENSRHQLRLWERLEFLSPSTPRFEPASQDRVKSMYLTVETRIWAIQDSTGSSQLKCGSSFELVEFGIATLSYQDFQGSRSLLLKTGPFSRVHTYCPQVIIKLSSPHLEKIKVLGHRVGHVRW